MFSPCRDVQATDQESNNNSNSNLQLQQQQVISEPLIKPVRQDNWTSSALVESKSQVSDVVLWLIIIVAQYRCMMEISVWTNNCKQCSVFQENVTRQTTMSIQYVAGRLLSLA